MRSQGYEPRAQQRTENMGVKSALEGIKHDIIEMSEQAGAALANKNLSDVLKDTAAKVQQALDHPDVEFDKQPEPEQLPFGTSAPAPGGEGVQNG